MRVQTAKVLAFAAALFAFPTMTLISEKPAVSYNENRVLASAPKLTFSSYLDESFADGASDWMSDRFVARESFIKIKNASERLTGRSEIGGVLRQGDALLEVFRSFDKENLSRSLKAIDSLGKKSGVPTFFSLVPTAQEIVYSLSLPRWLDETSEARFISECMSGLASVTPSDITSALREHSEDYIYYRTDHHWTSYGAFLGYTALGEALGYAPLPLSSFERECVSEDFRGTLFSKTLDSSVTPDSIELFTPSGGEPSLSVTSDGKTSHSLFVRSFLDGKDKYAVFTGNNKGVVQITNDSLKNGKSLLLVKDSYANSLVPFLINHFEKITLYDPRYATVTQTSELAPGDYSQILVLFNVIGFSEETSVTKLNFFSYN